jgi:hypothetical protein
MQDAEKRAAKCAEDSKEIIHISLSIIGPKIWRSLAALLARDLEFRFGISSLEY